MSGDFHAGFKAGDVALATRLDGSECRAIMRADGTWRLVEACVNNPPVAFRRLFVVDIPDITYGVSEAACVVKNLRKTAHPNSTNGRIADQIEAQIQQPKPEEPGPWGVVEASCVHDTTRRTWVNTAPGFWYPIDADSPDSPDDWDSLVDPEILREGVTS